MNSPTEIPSNTDNSSRLDLIRDLVYNYQLLQLEFHRTSDRSHLIERMHHFIKNISPWKNFGFAWLDPETSVFDLKDLYHPEDHSEMDRCFNNLIDTGSFASALQLSRTTTIPVYNVFATLAPIRSGEEIKGVFFALADSYFDKDLEFEFHFLSLALNSLGGAVRRIESHFALTSNNEDLGKIVLRKVSESEEARLFAEASTRRMSDVFALFNNEILNSLNGVMGFTQLILESSSDPEERDHLEYIYKSGDQIKKISHEFQRPRTVIDGILSVDIRSSPLLRLWTHFTKEIEEIFKQKNRAVLWKSKLSEDLRIDLDEIRLRQLLYSLAFHLDAASEKEDTLSIQAEYTDMRHEIFFSFRSPSLKNHLHQFDFTVYAPLDQLLELNRSVSPLSFGICRSIAKLEGWILEENHVENGPSSLCLRIHVSKRSRYEQLQ